MYERFRKGETFVNAQEQLFRIAYLSSSSVFFESEEEGAAPFAVTVNQFHEQLQKEEMAAAVQLSTEIDKLDAYQEKHFQKRKPYMTTLKSFFDEGKHPTSTETYTSLCKAVQDEYFICKHPGESTIGKWWKSFKDAKFVLGKSLPAQPKAPKRLNENAEDKLSSYVQDVWLDSSSKNIARAHYTYKKMIARKNKDGLNIKIASESTFRRRLIELNRYNEIYSAGNYNEIKKANRTLIRKIKTSRILERVEVDRATLNLALLDDDTLKPTGNVSIYVAIDCHSRLPIGFTIEFGEAESSRGVLNLIKQIYIPMSNKFPFSGPPEKVIADNGPGFIAERTNYVHEKLKIEYIRTPTGQGWKKPFAESFFNTLISEFLEGLSYRDKNDKPCLGMPGFLGKRTDKRSTRPPIENIKKAAQIRVSEFMQAIHDYLVLFANSKHSQLNGMTPAEKWEESVSKDPILQVDYDDIAHHFRLNEERRKLESRGTITLNNQKYASQELKTIYNQIALVKTSGEQAHVTIKFDPDDARFITVIYQIPGEEFSRTIEIPHREFGEHEKPISFEELNADRVPVTPRPVYEADFTPIKQKVKPRQYGKKVPDLKKEFSQGLDAKKLITKNNTTKPLANETTPTKKQKKKTKKESVDQGDFFSDHHDYKKWQED